MAIVGMGLLVSPAPAEEEPAFEVVAVLSHERAFDRPHDVELQGDLAFVPGKGGSLAIVDVSKPQQPRLVWHRHDPELLDDAETVLPAGRHLFLGTNDFFTLDVEQPRQPTFANRLREPERVARINGMARRGDLVLAACKHGWMNAFDVAESTAPRLAAAVNVRRRFGLSSPHDLDLHGNHAVVVDPRGFGRKDRPGGVGLVRVFDDAGKLLPPEDWTRTGIVVSRELSGANRVQVSGEFAFVGASEAGTGGRLVVLDLSDPERPRQAAVLPFANGKGYGPNGLTLSGRVVFLAGGQTVEAIDVRRPERPVTLASQRITSALPTGRDNGHDLVHRDGYLYVTGQNDHCLVVLRVTGAAIRRLAEEAGHAPRPDEN